MMFEQFDRETASAKDRVAWALCQIIDDDAPLRWTRYRFAAGCIARNSDVMRDLHELSGKQREGAPLRPVTEDDILAAEHAFEAAVRAGATSTHAHGAALESFRLRLAGESAA